MAKFMVEKIGEIGKVTIREESGKFILVNTDFMRNLIDSLKTFEKEKSVRYVIIRGIGNFGAGADINELKRSNESREYATQFFLIMSEMFRTLFKFPKVIIANVEGVAYGASMEMLLATDFVVATKNARFAAPGGRLGVFPPVLVTFGRYKLGWESVYKLAFLGEELDAYAAQDIGLVHEITDDFESANAKLIDRLKQMAPSSLSSMRLLLYQEFENIIENAFRSLIEQVLTEDARNGITAFLTKTKPRWTTL